MRPLPLSDHLSQPPFFHGTKFISIGWMLILPPFREYSQRNSQIDLFEEMDINSDFSWSFDLKLKRCVHISSPGMECGSSPLSRRPCWMYPSDTSLLWCSCCMEIVTFSFVITIKAPCYKKLIWECDHLMPPFFQCRSVLVPF